MGCTSSVPQAGAPSAVVSLAAPFDGENIQHKPDQALPCHDDSVSDGSNRQGSNNSPVALQEANEKASNESKDS
eukprot:scaffold88130_cov15-Prasinocladus_malaysianus.AAC.1